MLLIITMGKISKKFNTMNRHDKF